MVATVVSIIKLKGGVGKSTLTMIIGEMLAFRYGKNVLLIDMDAQANLSYCMVPGHQIEAQNRESRTTYHLFRDALQGKQVDISRFITHPPLVVSNIARGLMHRPGTRVDMVVSTPTVAQLDEDLMDMWEQKKPVPRGIREVLSNALDGAKERYSYILIDCPPGLSLFSSTALMASDYYISPVIPEPLSLQGVGLVGDRVTQLRERYGATVEFKGVLLNIVKHYRTTHRNVSNHLFGAGRVAYTPFKYWLPDNERLRKLGEFDPDLEGDWAGGEEQKFESVHAKYSLSFRLANPPLGFPLSRSAEEGERYRLEERIAHLVEEFQDRCP